jgi:hypothetical protein
MLPEGLQPATAEDQGILYFSLPGFYSNSPSFTYELPKEEILTYVKLASNNGVNYKVDFTSLRVSNAENVKALDKGEYILLEFSKADPVIHEFKGYKTVIHKYPLVLEFKINTKGDLRIDGSEHYLLLYDLYNGSSSLEILRENKKDISKDAIEKNVMDLAVQRIYEGKKIAWDDDLIIVQLLSVNSTGDDQVDAKVVYQYMKKNYTYDPEQASVIRNQYVGKDSNLGLQKFVETKKGTCHQFAYLYKLFLDNKDIENRLAFGNFKAKQGYVDHIWNEVKINGEWIPVDTTGNGFGQEGQYENYVNVFTTNL